MTGFLESAVVYLSAAVICVPIAKRLGMGSVLGYLIAGIAIGPFAMGFIGQESKDVMHFAEFGVVMMLFLVGLELEPAVFWRMRKQVLGLGIAQVALTAVVIGAGLMLFGFTWQAGLAAGFACSMSSTAIALQSLKEKNLMNTAGGQSSFAVLLFQDIAVIPILAFLPLLAVAAPTARISEHWIDTVDGWQRTLLVLGAVNAIIVFGLYVVVPLLRVVTKTRLRELFTASALLLVVGIAFVMETVGLSPALGTFLAGVVLANSEFKHELESDLDPFKGLLLGLFFMGVGSSINFELILSQPGLIISLTLGIMLVKMGLLYLIGKRAQLSFEQNMRFSIGLAQVGEFAFVLIAFIADLAVLNGQWTDTLMAVTAISMTLTPITMLLNEKVILPRFGCQMVNEERPADEINVRNKVIIAGFGHFGSTLGRLLRANGVESTILDNDSDQVDLLRKMGFKVFYGDATRPELLEAAGAHQAEVLVCAIAPENAPTLVEAVHKNFPNLKLMVRSRNRMDAYELMDQGVLNIYRDTLDTSVRMGVDVLKELGFRHYTAYRAGQNFIKYDQAALKQLAASRHDRGEYVTSVREQIEQQEELLRKDLQHDPWHGDQAWDSEEMRKALGV